MTRPTQKRLDRVAGVLARRQPDLRVVLEGVTIAHNASAVIRTCDAAGVLYLDIVSPLPELVVFNRAITTRAERWLEIAVHASIRDPLTPLKSAGFTVAAAVLGEDTLPYTEYDYTRPTVLVFGGEVEGVSAEARELSDVRLGIPMLGMVQSLNLSVSAGIILYEAVRQRAAGGFLDAPRLPPAELERLRRKWLGEEPD